MKKALALILALILALSVAGCKDNKPLPTSPNATADPTVPSSEPAKEKEGVYIRDSYSVDDAKALADRETVVATAGEGKLTNGALHMYYWMSVYDFFAQNEDRLMFYGVNYTTPLDKQKYLSTEGTWQQCFLEYALGNWHSYQTLAMQAGKDGVAMSDGFREQFDSLEQTLEEARVKEGFASVDEMLKANMGAGCTSADYLAYYETIYTGSSYYDHLLSNTTFTEDQIDAWYRENEAGLSSEGVTKETVGYDVRHILVRVAEGKTDADWEKCRADAQALLDQWLAGEKTEDSFAAMAKEHSQDDGSKENGGLYPDLTQNTSFVKPFKEWYLDSSRQIGDYGLVKSDYGYHIMYFSGSGPIWQEYCRKIMVSNAVNEKINGLIEANPISIDYEKISLAVVDLVKEKAE